MGTALLVAVASDPRPTPVGSDSSPKKRKARNAGRAASAKSAARRQGRQTLKISFGDGLYGSQAKVKSG
jgi:hypothetical protein